jgi:hypothetical protein
MIDWERIRRVARVALLVELGIKWPISSEEHWLCCEVKAHYTPELDRKPGEWIASRYGRDKFTYACIIGGDNGRVWLRRKFEPAICVDGSPFAITRTVITNWLAVIAIVTSVWIAYQ